MTEQVTVIVEDQLITLEFDDEEDLERLASSLVELGDLDPGYSLDDDAGGSKLAAALWQKFCAKKGFETA